MFLAQTLVSPFVIDGLMTARIPTTVDIAAVRRRTGMSQEAFAAHIGVSLFTLRNWEQGKRSPEGPALVLLAMLEKNPNIVDELLGDDDA